MDNLSLVGNLCSIGGLLLSVWLLFRTGRIQKSVNNTLQRKDKIANYTRNRENILNGISDCASFLINDHTFEEQLPAIEKLDGCLADFVAFYPYSNKQIEKTVQEIRTQIKSTLARKQILSYIEIIKPLHDVMSILKKEAMYYD